MNLIPLFAIIAVIFVFFVLASVRASRPLECPECKKRGLEAVETGRSDGQVTQIHQCRFCNARFKKQGDTPLEKL